MPNDQAIPNTGTRSTLVPSVKTFLDEHPNLHLGGKDFHAERRDHLEIFGFHNLPKQAQAPIGHVHFDGVRGRHGTIPVRLFYPRSYDNSTGASKKKFPALIYFHGGGYTVGSVDEFENGLRLLAEAAEIITIGVEYRLAPEWPFPTQLDEYEDVLSWTRSPSGARLGIDPERVLGGGDSAGGNMTAGLSLRLKDEGKQPLQGQVLLYPEARLPFDTPAASENNSGYYLECNGIFSFADHYLPRAPYKSGSDTADMGYTYYPPAHRYVSPGMQAPEKLEGLPPAAVFTCGFDPLRDVGVEFAGKLRKAGNRVAWMHYPGLTHGFLQMAPWSGDAARAVQDVGRLVGEMSGRTEVLN
ncbi:Alpha/Beta hydrolase protein [Annulohypoxylon truncatum]|uniref:Alpha/Beta hydrolase protein n=1 Tax=Annulohypoxylon truncatum TaxID=327061 RepID=UPI002007E15D|nr:Alpha/Beta hydrolase protein [Annulohypoxylon truncatum]KAI1207590.1 Alpha/Beta hydrolase protein [Annulohypoxylon truncatum]